MLQTIQLISILLSETVGTFLFSLIFLILTTIPFLALFATSVGLGLALIFSIRISNFIQYFFNTDNNNYFNPLLTFMAFCNGEIDLITFLLLLTVQFLAVFIALLLFKKGVASEFLYNARIENGITVPLKLGT